MSATSGCTEEASEGRPAVLVIAATDSSGGAGITRDVRVLTDFGVDSLCVITAVTAQSDARLTAIHHVPPEVIRAQLTAAFATRRVNSIKIGMLGTRASVQAVADSLPRQVEIPIVLDPILVSSSGGMLLDEGGREAMLKMLFPLVTIVTPNVPEAAALLGEEVAANETLLIEQAQRLLALGPQAVLLKGGHAEGAEAIDLLVSGNRGVQRIAAVRLRATSRGTGCALASAIAAALASGVLLSEACQRAKRYIDWMLREGADLDGQHFSARSLRMGLVTQIGQFPGNRMTTRLLRAEIHQTTLLHDGFLRVYRYEFEVEKHDGGSSRITREVMERGDAVAVLGYDPSRDEILLGNEFRPGVLVAGEYPYRDNLVAGGIGKGETALEAAVREMQEEAGLVLRDPVIIHRGAFVSSGGTSERIALVFGLVDTSLAGGVHGLADESEDILSVVLPAQVFVDRVRKGEINDLKTLVAGYWFAERHANGTVQRTVPPRT